MLERRAEEEERRAGAGSRERSAKEGESSGGSDDVDETNPSGPVLRQLVRQSAGQLPFVTVRKHFHNMYEEIGIPT